MAGYTRQDTSNNISNGNVIDASDLDAEFNQIQASMNSATGHTHGGADGEGAPITVIGPAQDVVASGTLLRPKTTAVMSLGSSTYKWVAGYFSGALSAASAAITGTVTAALFSGSGASLTNLNGTNIASGTVADARIASTLVRTSRTLTAGNGLTGGGDLSANRSLAVGEGDGITVGSTSVGVDSTVVRTTRSLTAGAGLTGGGSLAADRSFAVGAGDGISVTADAVAVDSTVIRTTGDQTLSGIKSFANRIKALASLTLKNAGIRSIYFTDGSETVEGAVFSDPTNNMVVVRQYEADGTTPAAQIAVRQSGLVDVVGDFDVSGTISGNGSGLTNLDGTNIGSGTVAEARISSAIARSATTISAGNGITGGGSLASNRTITLGTPSSITTTSTNSVTSTSHTHELSDATVRGLIAESEWGEVGTYGLMKKVSGGVLVVPGATTFGDTLRPADITGAYQDVALEGIWRAMGYTNVSGGVTLWLRIS